MKKLKKTAFIRSLPFSTPGPEVVQRAKEAGIDIPVSYVYSVRAKTRSKALKRAAEGSPAKRGPGRPPKSAGSQMGVTPSGGGDRASGALVAEIEAIVERKVRELLTTRLGNLLA